MGFSDRLLCWYDVNKRVLPWRDSYDPYKVWVSEAILQQTRIEQGIAYYYRFLDAFPDVNALAAASEDEVLRLWQGLGYYSRARNLHYSAREIVTKHQGKLPETSQEWLKLKGVGPYTAAAITSIAFNEAVPAVDGNAFRVLARAFALSHNIDSTKGKVRFNELASRLINKNRPGDFNQAMMDLGALICKPLGPLCEECPLKEICVGFQQKEVDRYPVRSPKRPVRNRFFNYFRITTNDHKGNKLLYVNKREANDIWKNMYDFPLLETQHAVRTEELFSHPWWQRMFPAKNTSLIQGNPRHRTHKLTHQTIHVAFYSVYVPPGNTKQLDELFLAVSPEQFEQMAKPKLIDILNRET